MTRDEAGFYLANMERKYMEEGMSEALDMAIKALKQEPYKDAISRQAVIELCDVRWLDDFAAEVRALPSVSPQQRTGEWIEHFDESGKWYECDQCHTDWGGSVNYCPNCGAKMEVE